MSSRYPPEPSQIDYHSEIQEHRVQRAMKSRSSNPGWLLSPTPRSIHCITWSAGCWTSTSPLSMAANCLRLSRNCRDGPPDVVV
jgi:hypothetical protein